MAFLRHNSFCFGIDGFANQIMSTEMMFSGELLLTSWALERLYFQVHVSPVVF